MPGALEEGKAAGSEAEAKAASARQSTVGEGASVSNALLSQFMRK